MAEEMRTHLEMEAAANRRAGMSPKEAQDAAQRQFGGIAQIQERSREQRGFPWIGQLTQDLRYAGRQLRRNQGFSAVAIVTLALGIGACTAVFSVINGVMLHPLDQPGWERIVILREARRPDLPDFPVSPPNFIDWEKTLRSFESMAAFTRAAPTLHGGSEPQRLSALKVTARYFDVYGEAPSLGRAFLSEDCAPGRDHVAVVSHGFWQRNFGGAADAVGRTIQLDGEPYVVIGVAPPGFDFTKDIDIWLPLTFTPEMRMARGYKNLTVLARLRPGVTAAQADAEIRVFAAQLEKKDPGLNHGWSAFAMPVLNYFVRDVRSVLFTLLGAVSCVLLIACANLANLLLARAGVRQREISIRGALGASRARLLRQLLTESTMLALAGGLAGVLVAIWGLHALLSLAPASMPRLRDAHLDGRLLAGSLALSIITGFVFGLAPAWLAARINLNDGLKQGGQTSTEGEASRKLRSILVVFEVAAALVLFAGAGLLTHSAVELARVGPGFDLKGGTVLSFSLSGKRYHAPEQRLVFTRALLGRLQALPGVSSVGVANTLPLTGGLTAAFLVDGLPPVKPSDAPVTTFYTVSPDYFRAIGIRLLRGRFFSASDDARAPLVAIVNETLARQQFPNEDPIGKRAWLSTGGTCEIVGVVNDVAHPGVDRLTATETYLPFAQWPDYTKSFSAVIRSAGSPAILAGLLRPAVHAIDQDQAIGSVRPLEQIFADVVARQRFATTLLGVFSVVALVIAAVGVYGVMAYEVTQRTTEIGVRVALGAQPRDVLRLVFGHGGRIVGLGLLLGFAGTLAAARAIQSMLYHTSARDPFILSAIALVVAGVGAIACLVPARRAMRVDPIIALHAE
jgi:putative ABC transport system permease protein